MKTPAKIIGVVAVAAVLVPAFAYVAGAITLDQSKATMLVATIVWFAAAPVLFSEKSAPKAEDPTPKADN